MINKNNLRNPRNILVGSRNLQEILEYHKKHMDDYLQFRDDLKCADFQDVDLSYAVLSWAILEEADLSGSILTGAWLNGANLTSANLTNADLSFANLKGARLDSANLTGCNLYKANISFANVDETNFQGAFIKDIIIYDTTGLGDAIFSDCTLDDELRNYLSGINPTVAPPPKNWKRYYI